MANPGIRLTPLVLLALVGFARPVNADKIADARALAQEGNTHYAVGEFAAAGEKFQEAYKLHPDAALLYNAAQAFRLAGSNAKALVLYRNYLQFYPKEANIDSVRTQIDKLQATIAASTQAITSPPVGTAEHSLPPPDERDNQAPRGTIAPVPATAPSGTTTTTPAVAVQALPKPTPVYKKWWLWTIVGVVVMAAAVTGAVLAAHSTSWSTTNDLGPGARSQSALTVRW